VGQKEEEEINQKTSTVWERRERKL